MYDSTPGRFAVDDQRALESAAAVLVSSIARDEAERATGRDVRQPETLREIGHQALTATLDQAFTSLASVVADVLGVEFAGLGVEFAGLARAAGDHLFMVSRPGPAGLQIGERIPLDISTVSGKAYRSGTPIVVVDMRDDPQYALASRGVGARSGVAVPIPARDRFWGVAGGLLLAPNAFGDDALPFLAGVANVVAAVVERDRQERTIEQQSDEEFAIVRNHTVAGDEIARRVAGLGEAALAVRHHRERWDGSGYPDRLAGTTIPFGARIAAAADACSALTSDRPYHDAEPREAAPDQHERCAGSHFDPDVVGALRRFLRSDRVRAEASFDLPRRAERAA